MDTLGDLAQQCAGDGLVGWVVLEVDRDEQLLSLLVDITDIDTTLVGEEDPVTLDGDVSECIVDVIGESGAVAERHVKSRKIRVKGGDGNSRRAPKPLHSDCHMLETRTLRCREVWRVLAEWARLRFPFARAVV